MADFAARRPPPARSATRRPAAPGSANSTAVPPFGTTRGRRVAYTVNLEPETVVRVDKLLASNTGTTYGMVAVEAIRASFDHLLQRFGPNEQDPFPTRRISAGRIAHNQTVVRKVCYVTLEEAWAIESARQRLGGLELGQLHRLALDLYLNR